MYSAQNTELDPTEPHHDPSVLPTAAAGTPGSADLAEPSPLVPVDGTGLLTPDIVRRWSEEIGETLQSSIAANTRRGYQSDWKKFTEWCAAYGVQPLPAPPGLVMAYLTERAREVDAAGRPRYASATLTRWLSSINSMHAERGHRAPGSDKRVSKLLAGIKRERGTAQRRMNPMLTGDVRALLESLDTVSWPAAVAATRDAALLLTGFAGAFRRSELSGLVLADVVPSRPDGIHLRLERSKTDQEGQGTVKALPYGRHPLTCPPCALWRWIAVLLAADGARATAAAGTSRDVFAGPGRLQDVPAPSPGADRQRRAVMRALADLPDRGVHICRDRERVLPDPDDRRPLFRAVTRAGRIGDRKLSGSAVNEIVKRRVAAIGLNPDTFGGHSMRAGFVTEAFRRGENGHAIRRQTGHKGDAILDVYFRENAPLVNNAVTQIGL